MANHSDLEASADALRARLLDLVPAGPQGFEGLMQAALAALAGLPFRLARSGDQGGRDGSSASDDSVILFEAKLYENPLPAGELLKKVAQVSVSRTGAVDLWIACVTVDVGAVAAGHVAELARQLGLSTLILDWPASGPKPLADLLAAARDAVVAFWRRGDHARNAEEVGAALETIAAEAGFEERTTTLRDSLTQAALGLAAARPANRAWLEATIGDRRQAQIEFGQPLALFDSQYPKAPRTLLLANITEALASAADQERIIGVLGEEGVGKSWAALDSAWQTAGAPVVLVLRPRDLAAWPAWAGDLDGFLARLLVRQTGGQAERDLPRWRRRLVAWASTPAKSVRMLALIDGVGERIDLKWAEMIDALSKRISGLGGRVVFTCRPGFFRERLRTKLGPLCACVDVLRFTDAEVAAILSARNIDATRLAETVKATLRSPRLLSVALTVFAAEKLAAFEELSVEHILYAYTEHVSAAGLTHQSGGEFRQTIVAHARSLVTQLAGGAPNATFDRTSLSSRLGVDPALATNTLVEDFTQIVEGRFFSPDSAHITYQFERATAPIALGLALAAHVTTAPDPRAALEAFLPPIAALDQTSSILLSALTAAAIEQRAPNVIGELLAALAQQQNLSESLIAPMLLIARAHADATFLAAEALAGRGANRNDFFDDAVDQIARSSSDVIVDKTISRWLRTTSFAPERALFLHGENAEAVAKKLSEQAERVAERRSQLTPSEAAFVRGHLLEADVDAARLHGLAVTMLARRPLAGFVDDLYAWSFAECINSSLLSHDHQLRDRVRFNAVDWRACDAAVRARVEDKVAQGASRTGKWAAFWLLDACANPDGAAFGETLVRDIRRAAWSTPRKVDAADPSASEPDDMDARASRYVGADVSQLAMTRDPTSDRHMIDDGQPLMARFRPKAAMALHRGYAADVLKRADDILYLGGSDVFHRYAPLINRGLARAFVARLEATPEAADESLSERKTGLNYGLMACLGVLPAEERIDAVIALSRRAPILLTLGAMLTHAKAPALLKAIEAAAATDDDNAAGRLFYLASETAPLDEARLVPLALRFLRSDQAATRQSVLAYSAKHKVAAVLSDFARSPWRADAFRGREAGVERWYGSRALVEAYRLGFLSPGEALTRMEPSHACDLARYLDAHGLALVSDYLGQILAKLAAFRIEAPLLDVELDVAAGGALPRFHVEEPPASERGNLEHFMAKFNETGEMFATRQRARHERFDAFLAALDEEGVRPRSKTWTRRGSHVWSKPTPIG